MNSLYGATPHHHWPYRCPVCNGAGMVERPHHIPGTQLTWLSGTTDLWPCRSCYGKAIVWGPPEITGHLGP